MSTVSTSNLTNNPQEVTPKATNTDGQNGKVENATTISAKKPSKKNKTSFKHFFGIFRYVFAYKTPFIIGLIFLTLSTATSLSFPYFASLLADAATGKAVVGERSLGINQIALFLVGILVVQGIFSYLRIWLFAIVSENAMADIRRDMYARIISLPLPFFEERRVGELTSRIAADVSQLQTVLSTSLAEFLRQIATLIVGVIIIAFTSPKLTLVMLSTFPVAIIAAMVFGRYIRKLSRKTQDALADSNIVVEETLQSIQTVKSFTNEWYERQRYNSSITSVINYALRAARFRGAFVSFLISAVFGGIVLVLWVGAGMVANNTLTIGELLRFVLYTFFIGGALGGMGDLYGNIQKAAGASERIDEILQEQPEIPLTQTAPAKTINISSAVSFNKVTFSYPTRPDLQVLNNISFSIQQGQKVALVGPSGAGKSTIIQLLQGFYPLQKGSIHLGNQPINTIDKLSLRSQIGVVPQEVILFGGTISENIAYGKPNATANEIEAAALKANALDFINAFPEGFNTLVGERGVKLSGGQRQRIAIARAILKDPRLLILDEATSSLDAESEQQVKQALNVLMQNRTTIIIAHRLATIRQVDTILVLQNGKIIERGNHEELSQLSGGLYQNLLRLQFQEK